MTYKLIVTEETLNPEYKTLSPYDVLPSEWEKSRFLSRQVVEIELTDEQFKAVKKAVVEVM